MRKNISRHYGEGRKSPGGFAGHGGYQEPVKLTRVDPSRQHPAAVNPVKVGGTGLSRPVTPSKIKTY